MATVSQRDKLWNAISQNDLEEVQRLLFPGGNIDLNEPCEVKVYRYYDDDDGTAETHIETEKTTFLLHACLVSSPILVSALVKAGANVNDSGNVVSKQSRDKNTRQQIYRSHSTATPLILAVIQRNVELVEKLLHRFGADVNGRNDAGFSALHLTVKPSRPGFNLFGYEKIKGSRLDSSPQFIARLLLKAGAIVDLQDNMGQTPLHIATKEKDVATVQLFVQHGATVDIQNSEGMTPLHIAVVENDVATAKILLQHGARADIKSNEGLTPLYMSIHKDSTHHDHEMCKLLIQKTNSSALNCAEDDGTPLLHAMIEKRINFDKKRHSMKFDNQGLWQVRDTTMQRRCEEAEAVVKLLIEKGANLEATKDHLTPLHLAVEGGLLKIVKLLVEAGADIHAETPNTGLTPLDMAEHGGHKDIVNYLTARKDAKKNKREKIKARRDGKKNKQGKSSVEQEEGTSATSVHVHVEEEVPAERATGLCGFLTQCCPSRRM